MGSSHLFHYNLDTRKTFWLRKLRQGICGSFFLLLSFSCSEVVNFFKWKNHLNENIAIFHSNDALFSQYVFFEQKKASFVDFLMTTWEQESDSERKKKAQFLLLEFFSYLLVCIKSILVGHVLKTLSYC